MLVPGPSTHCEDNTMAPCVINGAGVGEYDATDWIEAENFFDQQDATKFDQLVHGGGDGFAVEASSLTFPHVRGLRLPAKASVSGGFTVVAANGGATAVAVMATSAATGHAIAKCIVQPTGSWSAYAQTDCALDLTGEIDEVELVLTMAANVRLDRFAVKL